MYNQEAGNATLYVDGVAVDAQTSIPNGGAFTRDAATNSSLEQQPPGLTTVAGDSDYVADSASFSTALRIGAGPGAVGARGGSTGFIGVVDEAFVYGAALSVEELDYLYRAAQVRNGKQGMYSNPLTRQYLFESSEALH